MILHCNAMFIHELEESAMKKLLYLCAVFAVLAMLSSCASFFASMFGFEVDAPETPQSSMVLVELIACEDRVNCDAQNSLVKNSFQSGFFPVVTGPGGAEVPFNHIEALTEAGLVFFKENIPAGTYTLEGIRYLWMTNYNFLHSPIKDLKFDGQREDEFIEVKYYPMPQPITMEIQPGSVASFGRIQVYYQTKYAAEGSREADDEYDLAAFSYEGIYPEDRTVLNLMDKWQYGSWPDWNRRK